MYDSDFHLWTQQQAKLLREGDWQNVDIKNLIEEIEALGRQERKELKNRLGILLGHLLKWQFQPKRRSKSWLYTIREKRSEIIDLFNDSPSLKSCIEEIWESSYEKGVNLAEKETSLECDQFPSVCPYSLDQILDDKFWPED